MKHCDLHRCEKNIELKENTSLQNGVQFDVMEYNLELRITNYLNKLRREIT